MLPAIMHALLQCQCCLFLCTATSLLHCFTTLLLSPHSSFIPAFSMRGMGLHLRLACCVMLWLCMQAKAKTRRCSEDDFSYSSAGRDGTLPCVEVPPCSPSPDTHTSSTSTSTSTSLGQLSLDQLADGGSSASSSNISICFNDTGLVILFFNFNQEFLTQSSAITECNDPVSSSNSASVYITPHDARGDTQCFTEFDVSPTNVSYHAGVFVSRLPIPPQSFEINCNSSGLSSSTLIETDTTSWQLEMFLEFPTINCPNNCPALQTNCARVNTSLNIGNDNGDNSFSEAESVYRANFFRVNEVTQMSGNGMCTTPQNNGRCQTLAWEPTSDLYNMSNFGYLLLQLPEVAIADTSYENDFDNLYTDVSIILAIFVFLALMIYVWCFENLEVNRLHPRAVVSKSTSPSASVMVTIKELSYFVPVPDRQATTDGNIYTFSEHSKGYFKQLLHSVDLTIEKNKVTAIMGPSGAGKTTLMDLIVSRKQDGVMVGSILFNGAPLEECAYDIAYVQSTDVQIGEFTVMQSLYFAALLRINSNNGFKKEDCFDHCVEVAASVGLTDVLNTVVGSSLQKGISGGQMRRLTIATELLADPHIICLDEPTTGLDSVTSLQLAMMLNKLAIEKNKTILCTVHQPSDDMLNIWDRLILMGNGKVIYSGDIDDLSKYMAKEGHVVSNYQNGLDGINGTGGEVSKSDCVEFVLELLHEPETLDMLAAQWSGHESFKQDNIAEKSLDFSPDNINPRSHSQAKSFSFEHVKVLVHRHALYSLLSPEGIRSIIARNLVSGGIYSVLYYQNFSILMKTGYVVSLVGTDFVNEFYNVMGLVYSIVTNVFMMNSVSVPALYQLNRFYSVEKEKNLYHFGALWFTFFLVDMLQQAFGALLFSFLIYRFVELDMPFLALFYPMIMLTALFASSVAMWCGMINKNATSALALFIVIAVFNMNFAGYLVTERQMEDWVDWLLPVSFMRYAVGLLFNEIFTGVFVLGEVLIEVWDYGDMTVNKCLLIAGGWCIGIQFLLLVAMFPWPSGLRKYASKKVASCKKSNASEIEGGAVNPLFEDADEERLGSVQLSSIGSGTPSTVHRPTQDDFRPSNVRLSMQTGSRGSVVDRISNIFESDRSTMVSYVENRQSYFDVTVARSVPEDKRVTFSFKNITYTIPVNSKDSTVAQERRLLRNVSGVVKPGEMMALMGPSGAGKTTLLNALAGRTNKGKMEGTLYINSSECVSLRAASSTTEAPFYAFVMQDDHHNPMLTVKDTLMFAAMLRKRTSVKEEVIKNVDDTIEILGLKHIQDDFVNTPEKRTMSNGQLRRLTIGVEVVCAPALIFLDEPTSGLDSYLALSVVNSLKSLAKAGHTILCTIHQPSSVTFDKFDKLTLLCAGEMYYHGEISSGIKYFEELGHPNKFANSAEYFIDVCDSATPNSSNNGELVSQMLYNIDHDIKMIIEAGNRCTAVDVDGVRSVNFIDIARLNLHMISTLFQRDLLTNIRRADFWLVCMLKALVAGVLTGLIFYDVEDNATIPRLAAGVVSFSYITLFLNEYTPICHDEKLIFYRENEVKVVSAFAQWFVVGFLFSLLLAISVLFYTAPLYYLMDLRAGSSHFIICYGTMLLQLFSSIYTVQLVVYLTPNATVTATIFPGFILLLQGSMCGFSILISTMADWFSWLKYPNAMYWAMNSFFRNEFMGNPHTTGFDSLAESFSYENSILTCFYMVVIISIAIRLLTLMAMNYVTFSKS